ncbi:MAG TPA: hypothetical protein VK658_21595 [Chryseolinea sp.]|nr:hypothetical protein [Chryseolinea sp.]
MFALLHFIFTIFKIAIQASLYATIILFLCRFVYKIANSRLLDRMLVEKWKFWWRTMLVISFGLFFYFFSYWGDHGLGDGARIPIGHHQDIRNGDGVWTYFRTSDHRQRHIYNFEVRNDKIFAEQDDMKYLIFDLKSLELLEFRNKEEYEVFAKKNKLPMTRSFRDFHAHYKAYWSGWRFWLLP